MDTYLKFMRLSQKAYAQDKTAMREEIAFEKVVEEFRAGDIPTEACASASGKLRHLVYNAFRLASMRQKNDTTEKGKE